MVWKGYKKAEGLDKILIIDICSSCLAYFIQNQFSFGHIPIITRSAFTLGQAYHLLDGISNKEYE
jgi:hypothetical protein